jgi:hypothetical protein
MPGITDYGPVSVPDGTIELRVHGVSGTPPESLLKASPVLIEGTLKAGFHRHAPSAEPMTAASSGVREAYAWGGLTSGSRISSALRLLLLPFSLVNVAGWMLPGVTDPNDNAPTRPTDMASASRRAATHALVTRLLAVCLTAYVTLGATWVATVAVERITTRYDFPLLRDAAAQARFTMLAVLALIAVWVLAARRTALAPKQPSQPTAETARVAQAPVMAPAKHGIDISDLWKGTQVTRRLSGVHAAIAIACAALLTSAALGPGTKWTALGSWLAWLAIAIAALGLFALLSTGAWGRRVAAAVRVAAIPMALIATGLTLAPHGVALTQTQMLKHVGRALTQGMASLAAAVLVLVLAQVIVGPRGGPFAGRLYASSFTVIGFGTAITGISGLAVIITWILSGRDVAAFVTGLAQTVAIIGLVSCSVAAIVILLQLNAASQLASVDWFVRLHNTIAHARGAIVSGACVFAVGANVVAATYLLKGGVDAPANLQDGQRGWASWGWFVIAAVATSIVAARLKSWTARIVATIVGAVALTIGALYAAAVVAAVIAHSSPTDYVQVILALSDQWLVATAVLAALVAPMAAVIGYMWRGSRDQSTRRSVGVVWDLVSFWPRQFHPWAPPPYTDTTGPELAARVQKLARESGAHTVIVSAHSQGAIIAFVALSQLQSQSEPAAQGEARVCLLTYGQLLDAHYRWLFPWLFNPHSFATLDEQLQSRWINLHRITDPLGHSVRTIAATDPARDREIASDLLLNMGPTLRPKTLNHGDYWYSQAVYEESLRQLARTDD